MQIFADKKFENPVKIIEAFDNKSFIEAFSQIEILRKSHYLLGYVRYEAKDIFLGKKIKSKYPLLYFEVYKKCGEFCEQNSSKKINLYPEATIDYKTYKKAIEQIKKEISNGNTYQVNYTYDYEIKTNIDGFELYKSILPRQKTPYNAYIKNKYEEILSFSPELFFTLEKETNGYKIKTKPMKGTVKRGKNQQEDEKNIEFLRNDIKNRAENVMIVDLLRNDLGKIAKTGTVKVDKLFEIETHQTVHQMTSEISAELDNSITLYDIFEALFPCGSVTGTPKINTMKIIDSLEIGKRNIYCGAIGLISPEKTVFSVPIRILQRVNGKNHFLCRVGGAIVWDSTPQDEWEETLTKIKFLGVNEGTCNTNAFQLIETILVQNGKMKYKTAHLSRMQKSAKEMGFKFNRKILKIKPQQDGIMRVLLNKEGNFETQELSILPIETNKITISQTLINPKEPMLYHKTTYRPWYERSMEKIKKGEIFDEIFFNEKGELTEGARSNIILQVDGKLYTPPVECGLLKGILRQKLLKQGFYLSSLSFPTLAPHLIPPPQGGRKTDYFGNMKLGEKEFLKQKLIEKKLYLNDLKKAEKIYCINSVRGIVEVKLHEGNNK